MTFSFDAQAVKALIDQTNAATTFRLTFGERFDIYGPELGLHVQPDEDQKGTPGLWLVKDSGVYLMSNATPPPDHQKGTNLPVVYAVGHGAETFLGGDDFCDKIPLADLDPIEPWERRIVITLTDTSLTISREQRHTRKAPNVRLG